MREYLLVAVIAGVVTYLTTPAIRWLAVRFGAVTPVRGRDVHSVPIPRLGGVGMLLGFAAAVLIASRLRHASSLLHGANHQVVAVLIAAAFITAVGAIDDFRELDPLTKFAGQLIAAGVMAFGGVQLSALPTGDSYTILPQPILILLTFVIVIAMTNAVNFADGLDGLAAGFVAIAAVAFFLWAYQVAHVYLNPSDSVFSASAFVSAVTAGCCLGFLPHNFFPARLFMGDAGALLLGLLLSASTITFTGALQPSQVKSQSAAFWVPIALPVAILALPVLDVILAVRRRGLRFWKPDRGHLHHKMLDIGHSHRRAVLLLYLWSASLALGVLMFTYVSTAWALSALVVLIAISAGLTRWLPRWKRGRSL
ncbi:MraY family glycosyltransferase [Allobranchiibius sp. GilTou38]|uniref:MraY family glycosyltransferase n=1 Tax=Allobranchiibius sp. GilTou38 TaxID=2815210 RepID=UPI001AA1BD42|nr:undecaprenyl/decaprenyl-phosphate alpha-N-acetylglucosaminyl 1-phosphate transferase [Allobranchiibius sp. GilTou38]